MTDTRIPPSQDAMTRDGAIATITASVYRTGTPQDVPPGDATRRWADELLDELEPYVRARLAEHDCDCTSDREAALAWAARSFEQVAIPDADALADVVLHVADRYHAWLAERPS